MKLINLYLPANIQVLLYMLQASEYEIGTFLHWYWTTPDFTKLRSEKLKPTTKTNVLSSIYSVIYLALAAGGIFALSFGATKLEVPLMFIGLGIILVAPILSIHFLLLILWLGTWVVQKPIEKRIISNGKKIFDQHDAIKIMVAGSYGKTTMKHILEAVLSAKYKVAISPGNKNTLIGQSRFAKGLKGDEEILILEAGEYQPGDVWDMCQLIQPNAGVITGVNEQHMLRMKDISNTLSTIFELADYLDEQQDTRVFVNNQSAYLKNRIKKHHLKFNQFSAGKWKIKDASTSIDGTEFTIYKGKQSIKVNIDLLGLHQIGPVACAVALASELGMTVKQIQTGIKKIKPHDRRFTPKKLKNNKTIIYDIYNGNPDGFLTSIEFLSNIKAKRRVYVTPGIIELGTAAESVHFGIGRKLAESNIEHIVLIKNRVTEFMFEGLRAGGREDVEWVEDGFKFYADIESYVKSGDVLLLQNSPREDFFYNQ